MEVRRITFGEISAYWREVDHFRDLDKKIREVVRRLGPYECTLADPRRASYGLFEGDFLVGATHLVEWSPTWLRYRTLNVRPAHRGGGDRGWMLICDAVRLDWEDWIGPERYLFGWVQDDHAAWARAHGFTEADGNRQDRHRAMIRPLADL